MPQILYGIDGGAPVSATDAYVIGPVTEVEPGKSFRWTEVKNTAITHEVELNAGGAQITTVHVTIRIERSIVAPPMDALS